MISNRNCTICQAIAYGLLALLIYVAVREGVRSWSTESNNDSYTVTVSFNGTAVPASTELANRINARTGVNVVDADVVVELSSQTFVVNGEALTVRSTEDLTTLVNLINRKVKEAENE